VLDENPLVSLIIGGERPSVSNRSECPQGWNVTAIQLPILSVLQSVRRNAKRAGDLDPGLYLKDSNVRQMCL
jgi:hypothetical protein